MNVTLKEYCKVYRGDLPHDFKWMVVDKWNIKDFVLLLRTQPDMPHKTFHRNDSIEKTFNLHRKKKNQEYNILRNGYLAQLSNCHESKYAIDILKSRINLGLISLSEKEHTMLYKYFALVEQWIHRIKEQSYLIVGETV